MKGLRPPIFATGKGGDGSASHLSTKTTETLQSKLSELMEGEWSEGEVGNQSQVTIEERLARLQAIFETADNDGYPGLNLQEFGQAINRTIGNTFNDEETETLFMKVDTNCDGDVNWEEFVTYMLLEYQERNQMMEMLTDKPFPKELREIGSRHHDMIVSVNFFPQVGKRMTKVDKIDYSHGRYVSLSKEGVVTFWSLKMKHLRSYSGNISHDRSTQPWFTDMVSMFNTNMLAIASTDRDIIIFDLSANKFLKRYHVTGLDNCITCMNYWVDLKEQNRAKLVWGDTSGNLYALNFDSALRGGLFGAVNTQNSQKGQVKRISFAELQRGHYPGVNAQKLLSIHEDWVCKITYLPEFDCILSCCQSTNTSMYFGDFEKKKSSAYFKVQKGILSFDYCPKSNVIATGGMDYFVRIWNPYMNKRAIVLLKGHSKPIIHIVINSEKNQVISIDKGKSIRVFNLTDQSCVQHISGRMIKMGPVPISSICFNPMLQALIIATNHLALLERKDEDERCSDVVSHAKPVFAALYNPVFKVVVSACQDSVVTVWTLATGEKNIQYFNAHNVESNGCVIPVEITAMTFDSSYRRLITGARNGTVKVWNFNNGACQQTFTIPNNHEVTGIVSTKHRIYITAWNRTVNVYLDGGGEESYKCWRIKHKEDILSLGYLSPNIIATGSYDGDIVIWSRDTGQVYCRLNAHESTSPIADNVIAAKERVRRKKPPRTSERVSIVEGNRNTTPSGSPRLSIEQPPKGTPTSRPASRRRTLSNWRKCSFVAAHETQVSPPAETKICDHPLLSALDKNPPIDRRSPTKLLYTRDEYDNVCKKYEAAVEKILFLAKRENDQGTAILFTSGAEGWVRAWSIHHKGGLLGQFNGAHKIGEGVNTMNTDPDNNYLITADTLGYVNVWDITDYCIKRKVPITRQQRDAHLMKLKNEFTYLRCQSPTNSKLPNLRTDSADAKRPPPGTSNPSDTMKAPLLVNSFRAHVRAINHVEYVETYDYLITSSNDCAVRLWTLSGRYIGTFGEPWNSLPTTPTDVATDVPLDLRRAGSARSLRVLNGGNTPHWHIAMNIIRHRGIDRLKGQFSHMQPAKPKDQKGATEAKLETSNILGKSYKRKLRHKLPPILSNFIETPTTIAVYHSLPFVDLTPISTFKPPQTVEEMNQRKMLTFARDIMSSGAGKDRSSKDQAGVMGFFNRVVQKGRGAQHLKGLSNSVMRQLEANRRRKSLYDPETSETASRKSMAPLPVTMDPIGEADHVITN